MNEYTPLDSIAPGTIVVGVDGRTIGTVESAERDSLRVAGHTVPVAAIARVDEDRVLLHVARAAFHARRDPDLADAGSEPGPQH